MSDTLKIDIEWYMGQQVHPPIQRVCDPIDGTDSAQVFLIIIIIIIIIMIIIIIIDFKNILNFIIIIIIIIFSLFFFFLVGSFPWS